MSRSQKNKSVVRKSMPEEREPVSKMPRGAENNQLVSATYSGPIPPPSILQGYANIQSDLPDRIFKEFEKNSEHIRVQEKKALEAQISEKTRGQWMAFLISVLLLGILLYSLYIENYFFAGSSGVIYFIFLITSFYHQKT